jgi:glycosyltransferase involved in cell wall biosynthesis
MKPFMPDSIRCEAGLLERPSIAVGVVAYEEPARLRATIESVSRNTTIPHELFLMADGPDRETLEPISQWPASRLSLSAQPKGMASCLNRLVAESDAEIVVLLEAGSICGAGCLDRMVAAVLAEPRYGLAGPSTNLCWNEQGIFHGAGDADARGANAATRFGTEVRTLEPLYSLADFCYMVKREVAAEIGPADEDYGLGPCWEMDYNIRAERAGWRGIWVCGAYIERWPFTARRKRAEAELFERNKRRYQSKFCGRQLRGGKAFFRSHCRGASCPNFAPVQTPLVEFAREDDLITCLMPTFNRPDWVRRSIDCFLAQDYPRRELLILDDGAESITDIPSDPRIRYRKLPAWRTIGAKRNFGCELAQGEWIAHWDDDDWYAPDRLTRQFQAMRAGKYDVCGSSHLFYLDRERCRAFRYEWENGPRPWVAGSTFLYRKSFWRKHPFRDVQVGEDAHFVWRVEPDRLFDLRDPSLCVASLHRANTGRKDTSNSYWKPADFGEVEAMTTPKAHPFSKWPLVSCIMPTADRRAFLSLALRQLAMQHAVPWELVVVDDGARPVDDLLTDCAKVRYVRLSRRTSIGEKRNIACENSSGEIIAHWDDDDWYGPDRLHLQTMPLVRGEAEITGLINTHLLTLPDGDFWTPSERLHQRMYTGNVSGGTLVFWKRIWADGIRYPAANLAEDASLVRSATAKGNRLARVSGDGLYVYVRHSANSWRFQAGRFLDPSGWKLIEAPRGFSSESLDEYRSAARSTE